MHACVAVLLAASCKQTGHGADSGLGKDDDGNADDGPEPVCQRGETRDCDCAGEPGQEECIDEVDGWGTCARECMCEDETSHQSCRSDGWSDCFCHDDDGFIPTADVPVPSCDIWNPDCPPSEKCGAKWDESLSPDYVCTPWFGDGQSGDPCTVLDPDAGEDDCGDRLVCRPFDAMTWTGYCVPLCAGEPNDPSCPNGGVCQTNETWKLCSWPCTPHDGMNDCPGNDPMFTCLPVDPTAFACIVAAKQGAYLDPCLNDTECAFGFDCAEPDEVTACGGESCCTPYCKVGDGCPDALTCVQALEEMGLPPELEEIGTCVG